MQTARLTKSNVLSIISLILIGFIVFAACVESDPQQGMPGHMTFPRIINVR
jgi:hypothetical protein